MTIGFIGLGIMGMKMALNLQKNGFDVIGFNRTKSKEEEFVRLGGRRAASLAELGCMADAIIACLPNDVIVREMIVNLLTATELKFKLFIDCSTIDVAAAGVIGEMMQKRGVYYFDSPVSGGPAGAEEGTLTIMAGGDEKAFYDLAQPIFKAIGSNIMYFGENGSGQKAKLINQILTWVNHAVICEAAVLAKKAGLDMDKLYDCIMTSYGYSRVFEMTYRSHIQQENYENPTGMQMLVKDLKLAQAFAASYSARLPMTDESMKLYLNALEAGFGGKDPGIIMEQLKT